MSYCRKRNKEKSQSNKGDKRKNKQRKSRQKRRPEVVENHKNKLKGRIHDISQETKDKISKSNKGKKRTPEMNKQNSIRNTGKTI